MLLQISFNTFEGPRFVPYVDILRVKVVLFNFKTFLTIKPRLAVLFLCFMAYVLLYRIFTLISSKVCHPNITMSQLLKFATPRSFFSQTLLSNRLKVNQNRFIIRPQ